MVDPKALDAAFGRVLAQIALLLGNGDEIAIDGKALRGARDKGQSARTKMMVSAYAARLRLTLATVAADPGGELEAALEVLGLIELKGRIADLIDKRGRITGSHAVKVFRLQAPLRPVDEDLEGRHL